MITKIEPAKDRAVPVNADETLWPVKYSFDSGNFCIVTPSKRRLGDGRCAITVIYVWKKKPSQADNDELQHRFDGPLTKNPDYTAELEGDSNELEALRIAEQWLAGKVT